MAVLWRCCACDCAVTATVAVTVTVTVTVAGGRAAQHVQQRCRADFRRRAVFSTPRGILLHLHASHGHSMLSLVPQPVACVELANRCRGRFTLCDCAVTVL